MLFRRILALQIDISIIALLTITTNKYTHFPGNSAVFLLIPAMFLGIPSKLGSTLGMLVCGLSFTPRPMQVKSLFIRILPYLFPYTFAAIFSYLDYYKFVPKHSLLVTVSMTCNLLIASLLIADFCFYYMNRCFWHDKISGVYIARTNGLQPYSHRI